MIPSPVVPHSRGPALLDKEADSTLEERLRAWHKAESVGGKCGWKNTRVGTQLAIHIAAVAGVYRDFARRGLRRRKEGQAGFDGAICSGVPVHKSLRPSRTYFARFKVGGKLTQKSVKTTVFSVAKQRLPDTIRDRRANLESVAAFTNGKMKVGDAMEVYLGKVRASVSLKPRSKQYREMIVNFIQRSWPSLAETDVRKVTERDCGNWLTRYQQHYAPTVVNNSIGTLRAVFDEGVSTGARFNNPATGLSRVRVRCRRVELPSSGEFWRFLEEIGTAGARQSKHCADLVRFLAYSGVRIGEAKYVTWADVNFARREMHVKGHPITATKNAESRYIPMIPELERMLTDLRVDRSNEPAGATVMRVFECQKSMTHAAERIGMTRITPCATFSRRSVSRAVWTFRRFHVGLVTRTAAGCA